MSLWQNARSRQDDESAVLERPEVSLLGGDVTDARPNASAVTARPARVVTDRPRVDRAEADERDGSSQPGATADALTDHDGPDLPARAEPGFSRDLVDTYFRQMGNSELLSREGEIALAKRIEAAQQAVLKNLCRIPLVVAHIDAWCQDWCAGTLRIDQLVDPSMSDADLPDAGAIGREPADDDEAEARDGDSRNAAGQDANGAAPDSRFGPEVVAKLEQVGALAQEIGRLRRKGAAAVARGRAMTKADQGRLAKALAALGSEATNLRLHAERVNELTQALETEHRALQMVDRKLARLVGREKEQRAALARDLAAIEGRVGLPLADFRSAVSDIRKGLREVRTARE